MTEKICLPFATEDEDITLNPSPDPYKALSPKNRPEIRLDEPETLFVAICHVTELYTKIVRGEL